MGYYRSILERMSSSSQLEQKYREKYLQSKSGDERSQVIEQLREEAKGLKIHRLIERVTKKKRLTHGRTLLEIILYLKEVNIKALNWKNEDIVSEMKKRDVFVRAGFRIEHPERNVALARKLINAGYNFFTVDNLEAGGDLPWERYVNERLKHPIETMNLWDRHAKKDLKRKNWRWKTQINWLE